MMYVIKKDFFYVAKPGSKKSYTSNIKNAQKFSSREAAEGSKCNNEYVIYILDEIK